MININFANPYYLLIGIPLLLLILVPYFLAIRKDNSSASTVITLVLHVLISVCVSLAAAGMSLTAVMTKTEVYVVADVSYSSEKNLHVVDEYIQRVKKELPTNSEMGVVCFAKDYELLTPMGGKIVSVKQSTVDESATNISAALDYTATLFNNDTIKRIVLISDGKQTGEFDSLIASIESLYANDVYIDAMYVNNNLAQNTKEVQVSSVEYTKATYLQHTTSVDALIQSNVETDAIVTLTRGEDVTVEEKAVKLTPGYNVLNFDLLAEEEGSFDYFVNVAATGDETQTNNTYRFTQTVSGRLKVLLYSDLPSDVNVFTAKYGDRAEIDGTYVGKTKVPYTLEELADYDEIILSNLNICKLENYQELMESLNIVVSKFGKSLVTVGDIGIQQAEEIENDADAATLAEENQVSRLQMLKDMLPVMYGNDDRAPKLLYIVLDISRSMDQIAARLVMAKQSAIQLVNLMGDEDYIGVVGFAGSAEMISAEREALYRAEIIKKINEVQPYQGTFMTAALRHAFEKMSVSARLFKDKEIIVISDGMTYTAENESYLELAKQIKGSGIRLSTINVMNTALPEAENEADKLLGNMAKAGGGTYYPAKDESTLMQLVLTEVADAVTETVLEGDFGVEINRVEDDILDGVDAIPNVKGYVYGEIKSSATTVLTTKYIVDVDTPPKDAPIYAYWEYGNGKVSTFTSNFNDWTEDWNTESGETFFQNLLTVNTPKERIDYPYTLNIDYDGTSSFIEIVPVELNPDAKATVEITFPDGSKTRQLLVFDSARYYYEFVTPSVGRYEVKVLYEYGSTVSETRSYFNISYSPEYDNFIVFDPSDLYKTVRHRGTVSTDGTIKLENDEKQIATYEMDMIPPLAIAAVALFIIDILVRKVKWADIQNLFKKKEDKTK